MTEFDWKRSAETLDLFTLHAHDPAETLDIYFFESFVQILRERAKALPQAEIIDAFEKGLFGRYGLYLSDYIEAPGRYGYRDNDADAKELASLWKKKGTDKEKLMSVLNAARHRFDFSAAHSAWRPMHNNFKTRKWLLAQALDGNIDISADQRQLFSPFPAKMTRDMLSAGPLPLIPLKVSQKVEYLDPVSGQNTSSAPSYEERYMVAWAQGAAADIFEWGQASPLVPTEQYLSWKKDRNVAFAYLPTRHTYLVINKSGTLYQYSPLVRNALSSVSADLRFQRAKTPTEYPKPPLVTELCNATPDAVRTILLPLLSDTERSALTLGNKVLATLYSKGGYLEGETIVFPRAGVQLRSGFYDFQYTHNLYDTVTDGPPGPFHQIAYSPELQVSLCIQAEDLGEDPIVHEIDHEGLYRGNAGTLHGVLSYTFAPSTRT